MSVSESPVSPERKHLGRRLVLVLIVLLASATVTGLLVGMLLKTVVLFLIGLE